MTPSLSVDLKSSEAAFLRSLGSSLVAPVPVEPLAGPSIIWLNHRWFLQQGIDTLQPEVRASTEAWLLKSFALRTGRTDTNAILARQPRIAGADRYGGTGGAAHGGSGRTIFIGNFNAKGVGRTPLVPHGAEQGYASGFMPMREAIRETILSEIANAELPFGAVPTICLIDPAEEFTFDTLYGEEPRAIAVRPNFVRPAHFERSIFFGTAGSEGSDQQVDATRVRKAVQESIRWERKIGDGLFDPAQMFARLGRQIGVARAHRLWLGAFLTSNASVTGACVDFGSFRAVANWLRVYGRSSEVFGVEERDMTNAIHSVCHYFNKYGGMPQGTYDFDAIKGATVRSIAAGFREGCAIGLGLNEANGESEELLSLLLEYYQAQQSRSAPVDDPRAYRASWIYDQMREGGRRHEPPPSREGKASAAILNHLSALPNRSSRASASRWLKPRPILYYNILNARTRTAANLMHFGATASDAVFDYVTRALSAGRRVWPELPKDLDVLDQYVQPHFAALGCVRRQTNEKLLWIEAFDTAGRVQLSESSVPASDVERYCVKRIDNRVYYLLPWDTEDIDAGALALRGYRYRQSLK